MRLVTPGSEIDQETGPCHVARHHHVAGYAAIVLRGDYVEAGDFGRVRATAGMVLVHDWFEAHQDQFGARGADILNLPLPRPFPAGVGAVSDPEALAMLAARDLPAAVAMLAEAFVPAAADCGDWPDRLSADLRDDTVASLAGWADAYRLAPATVSRGFRRCYGVSPQRYRLEQRARRAAVAVRDGGASFAQIAAANGFSDQAHLSRTIRALYGVTLSRLAGPKRRHADVKCVQDGAPDRA